MMSRRRESMFDSVTQFMEKTKREPKEDEAQLQKTRKIIAGVQKSTASNLANIKRKTQHFASSDTSAVVTTLAKELRNLDEELDRRTKEIKDLADAVDELDNERNEVVAQTDEIEQEILEKGRALKEMRASSKAELKKLESEIELWQAMTGLHLADGGNFDTAAVVGYDSETGEPDIKMLSYGENSTSNELESVNKTWAAIESLAGLPE